ncbi:MAG: hypothetical protein MUC81_02515 [Bacteroidia bacterium]|jgi:hypothetical protein|nr:hypothetical protein [Bacteroidia bacterium]
MKTIEDLNQQTVYQRIGMALVCAQRVEFITESLISLLVVYDEIMFEITGAEFFSNSSKATKSRKMLGNIFQLLKLTPGITIEEMLNDYLKRRNQLVHGFWRDHLNSKLKKTMKSAIKFCDEFMDMSDNLESYFKGFMYFLELRHTQDSKRLSATAKQWENDFVYFVSFLENREVWYGNFMVKIEQR